MFTGSLLVRTGGAAEAGSVSSWLRRPGLCWGLYNVIIAPRRVYGLFPVKSAGDGSTLLFLAWPKAKPCFPHKSLGVVARVRCSSVEAGATFVNLLKAISLFWLPDLSLTTGSNQTPRSHLHQLFGGGGQACSLPRMAGGPPPGLHQGLLFCLARPPPRGDAEETS